MTIPLFSVCHSKIIFRFLKTLYKKNNHLFHISLYLYILILLYPYILISLYLYIFISLYLCIYLYYIFISNNFKQYFIPGFLGVSRPSSILTFKTQTNKQTPEQTNKQTNKQTVLYIYIDYLVLHLRSRAICEDPVLVYF